MIQIVIVVVDFKLGGTVIIIDKFLFKIVLFTSVLDVVFVVVEVLLVLVQLFVELLVGVVVDSGGHWIVVVVGVFVRNHHVLLVDQLLVRLALSVVDELYIGQLASLVQAESLDHFLHGLLAH